MLAALAVAAAAVPAAGSSSGPHGPTVRVAQGPLPSGGEYGLFVRRFGRTDICLTLSRPRSRETSCNEGVPSVRDLSATADVDCDGDTLIAGAITARVRAVWVTFGDGSRVRAALYPRVRRVKLRVRYFVAFAKGPVSVKRVSALGRGGQTLALGRFDFDGRCSPGGGFGGGPLITVPEPAGEPHRCGQVIRFGQFAVRARSIRAWRMRCPRARHVVGAYLERGRVGGWKCDLARAPNRYVCERRQKAVSFALVARR
jgi:hypothetical protein